MVLALGTDNARILDNVSLTEVDMLEPKGCDSIVAGARQKDQREQSPCPAFQHRYWPAWPPIHPAPVRASDRLGRGLLSDGIVLGRQIEIVGF
jgi:hypothetical protein